MVKISIKITNNENDKLSHDTTLLLIAFDLFFFLD